MAKRTSTEKETFEEVKAALDKALGKPKKARGIARYTAPADAATCKQWIARVHATGGSASLAEAYPARVLAVVSGRPSELMDLVTWVRWQFPYARKALDLLDADAGLRISNIKYTHFLIKLDRVPLDPGAHGRRLAKVVHMGDAIEIADALKTKRWNTNS